MARHTSGDAIVRAAARSRTPKPRPKLLAQRRYGIDITEVSFRANIPQEGSRFEHMHIEAKATVSDLEDAQTVLDGLKAFVHDELSRAKYGENGAPVVPRAGRFRNTDTPW